MALRCFPPHITNQCGPFRNPVGRVFMLHHHTQFPANKPPLLQIRSSTDNKVFEDESRGIICYRDASGEIICEGYDEGPRFHPQVPPKNRDLGIIDILRQAWFQILEDNEIHHVDKGGGGVVQEDLDFVN